MNQIFSFPIWENAHRITIIIKGGTIAIRACSYNFVCIPGYWQQDNVGHWSGDLVVIDLVWEHLKECLVLLLDAQHDGPQQEHQQEVTQTEQTECPSRNLLIVWWVIRTVEYQPPSISFTDFSNNLLTNLDLVTHLAKNKVSAMIFRTSE